MAVLPTAIGKIVAHVANYSTTKYTEARVLVTLVGLENIARVSPHCLMLSQVSIVCQTECVVVMLLSKSCFFLSHAHWALPAALSLALHCLAFQFSDFKLDGHKTCLAYLMYGVSQVRKVFPCVTILDRLDFMPSWVHWFAEPGTTAGL